MVNEIDDVAHYVAFGGTGDADGFVEADVNMPFSTRADDALVYPHFVTLIDLAAQFGAGAVDGDAAPGDPVIRFPARAQAGFADIFIQSHEMARRSWVGMRCGLHRM